MTAAWLVAAWTTALTAVVAVAATLLVLAAAAGWRALRRGAARPEDRMVVIVHDLERRMDEMGRELQDALEQTREESRRTRVLGELAGSIDLDEVLRRTLDAAGALPGADAALITVVGTDGEAHTASVGVTEAEADEHAIGRPPTGRRIRSMAISYDGGLDVAPGEQPPIGTGLAVPVLADLEPVGLLSVFSRGAQGELSADQLAGLEQLAARAGPAIENALRFRSARQLADLDALTGLHNRRYFHETLAREVARAQRYDRRLALLVFDLDDFKAINDRIGHLAGDAVLAQVAERVKDVVRSADIACRVGGDEFAVILPESTLDDADQLYRRLQDHLAARPLAEAGRMEISAGIAELRPQDDAVAFFQRADEALYRAKEGGKGRAAAATGAIGPAPALEPRSIVPRLQGQER